MPLSGYRILIVEDEALIALDLSHTLEDLHAIVVGPVNNAADARKMAGAATWHRILNIDENSCHASMNPRQCRPTVLGGHL
jgi:hypothetical protein